MLYPIGGGAVDALGQKTPQHHRHADHDDVQRSSKASQAFVRLARAVPERGWAMRREHMSPRFTTSWRELLVVT
ncbi:DUF4113 domain-containing protein (plasmid) [Pseudomonas aeruginosa]|nr:DUF4113 domain-containing protein [Pseudomonas aeruginosa]MBY9140088.1 DUF4113 domain-containing protein [Pseudomonas aeruginosa]MBY9210394.1 DUF4113 domain-containing protein [Pseudomonas aeruginosa]MBY9610590.1 DUF4113 domain-containing protein [Pseudomonas aeruginosa]MBY9616874.1 DUF4113 domain-containing protein [Pseudomonas aeruginosa]